MKEPQQIAIYSRKSRFTGRGESIENQIELCKQYICLHQGDAAAVQALVYEDEGFSGGNLDRPQFRRMMADARSGKLSAVVVYRLDRISRNIGDFAGLIDSLGSLKISFVSIKEQFDTNSPMGRAMMYIASVFSQLERETIAERIRDNMLELAKTGRWLGGVTPTGYASEQVRRVTMDGKVRKSCKLKVIPKEAELVRLIFSAFLETGSLTGTDAYLLRRGCTSKNGKIFTRFTIKGILTNPVYAKADGTVWDYFSARKAELFAPHADFTGARGVMAYNRTEQKPGRANRLRPMEEWIVALGAHEGLIEGVDWVKTQALLDQNRSQGRRRPRSQVALLSGLLFCGRCGSYMRPKLSQRKNDAGEPIYSYVCEMKERSRKERCEICNVNGNLLDRLIVEELKTLPQEDSRFWHALRQGKPLLKDQPADDGQPLESVETTRREKEREIESLVTALGKAPDSAAQEYLLQRIEFLHSAAGELRRQADELRRQTTQPAATELQRELLRRMTISFADAVDAMTTEERRRALRTCVRKVVWDGETAHLYLFGNEDLASPPLEGSQETLRENSK